jgi:TRAP-type C4-dicarboxylate transport system permease small subunit
MLLACRYVLIALVGVMATIVAAAVINRNTFSQWFGWSMGWSDDGAKFLMVWMTFIAAPLGFRHGAHVAIELLPSTMRRPLRIVVHAIVLFTCAMLAWYGWKFALNGWNQIALTIGDISMFWVFVCMPLGAAMMALVALELLILTALGHAEPSVVADEQLSTQGM